MNLKNFRKICCLSTSILTLFGTLSMSGCDRGPKTQKAATSPTAPVSPAAPNKPGMQGAQSAPATKAAPVPQARVGKYVNKKYPHDFIELKGDGTFIIQEDKKSTTGTFIIRGNYIGFSLKDGSGSASTIDDKGITDSNKELWTKQ